MPRKKKEPEAVYFTAGNFDNLIKISLKANVSIEQLRALNLDIKNCLFKIQPGKKVRLA